MIFATNSHDCSTSLRKWNLGGAYPLEVASLTVRTADWLKSSRWHLCALNCCWIAACASDWPLTGWCGWELHIAVFADSQHWNVVRPPHDPEFSLCHG